VFHKAYRKSPQRGHGCINMLFGKYRWGNNVLKKRVNLFFNLTSIIKLGTRSGLCLVAGVATAGGGTTEVVVITNGDIGDDCRRLGPVSVTLSRSSLPCVEKRNVSFPLPLDDVMMCISKDYL